MASRYKAGPASSKKGVDLEDLDSNDLLSSLDRILSEFETDELETGSPKKDVEQKIENTVSKRKPGPASRTFNDTCPVNDSETEISKQSAMRNISTESSYLSDINNNIDLKTLTEKIDKLSEIIQQGPVGPMVRLKNISAKFGSTRQRGLQAEELKNPQNVFKTYLKKALQQVVVGNREIKPLKRSESRCETIVRGVKKEVKRNVKPIPINRKLDPVKSRYDYSASVEAKPVQTIAERRSSRRSCTTKVNYNESKYFQDLDEEIKLNEEGNTDSDDEEESGDDDEKKRRV